MASDEQQIDKLIRDLNKASTYQTRYLFRCIAALRLNKAMSEITREEISAEYYVLKQQMDPTSIGQFQSVQLLRNELGAQAWNLARNYSRLLDTHESRNNDDRQEIRAFSHELECEMAFFEKDKVDLQAMIEETKAAAAMEVQRLMEENARSNSQIEALGAQNMELEKEAVKNAGIMEAQAREIAHLEEQITGLRVAAAAGEGDDTESGTMTFPFVLEEDGMFRYATKEEMAGKIDQKLVEAQKKPFREYFEEVRGGAEGYDASDEGSDAGDEGSVVSMDNGSVEDNDWAVVSAE